MFFDSYSRLSRRDRALADGRLITYHFYVGGVTLILLGLIDARRGVAEERIALLMAGLALAWGMTAIGMGVLFHLLHHWMIRSPQRDSYVATISVVLGRSRFPVLPAALWGVVGLSVLALVLRLLGP